MPSHGSIVAHVYTSSAELPLKGAAVAYTRKGDGGKHILLALRVTDESGKTELSALSTSDAALSTSPGAESPYDMVDLWVYYPGYEIFITEDVQIFPGVKTVQKVGLIPLPLYVNPYSRAEAAVMPPQDL